MSPQLVDLNADGQNDMVMATFEGTAFVVNGSEKGFEEPKHIVDSQEKNVRISMYYDMNENDYMNVDRSAPGEKNIEEHHLTSTAMVDWDADGDLDMILGAYEGALYLCINEGTKSEPKFSTTNQYIKADGKHLTIEGGLATPRVCDWNKDGLFDILCGGSQGGVFFYKNTGSKGKPEFAAAETLISSDNNGGDEYGSIQVPAVNGVPTRPGSSFHIEPVDYDNDGDLDILVGAQSFFTSKAKELNEEEAKELANLKKKLEANGDKMDKLFQDAGEDEEALEKIYDSKEFQKLQQQMDPIWERMEELQPSPSAANLIWLYRNKGGSGDSAASQTDAQKK